MMTKALVIKIQGDRGICRSVAGAFESPELRRLRLENAVLRRNRDALRRVEMSALRREIDARIYGRRAIWHFQMAFFALVGAACAYLRGGARR